MSYAVLVWVIVMTVCDCIGCGVILDGGCVIVMAVWGGLCLMGVILMAAG
jgi:hypothetical protein